VVWASFRCYLVGFCCSLFFVFLGCAFWCFVFFPLFSVAPLLCSPFGKLCVLAHVSAGSFLRVFGAFPFVTIPFSFSSSFVFAFLVGGYLSPPLFCSSGTKPYFVYLGFVFYGLVSFFCLSFSLSPLLFCLFFLVSPFLNGGFHMVVSSAFGLFCGSFCFSFWLFCISFLIPFSGGVRCLGSVFRLFFFVISCFFHISCRI